MILPTYTRHPNQFLVSGHLIFFLAKGVEGRCQLEPQEEVAPACLGYWHSWRGGIQKHRKARENSERAKKARQTRKGERRSRKSGKESIRNRRDKRSERLGGG